jgi:hypothetical protein
MRTVVEIVRIAIDNNMSARARLIKVVCPDEKMYDVLVGSTMKEHKVCAPQLDAVIAAVPALLPDQINVTATPVEPRR